MYHHFCVGLHLELKATHCVNPTCKKPLTSDWITSFSFQQKHLLSKKLKQEKGCIIVSTTRSIQGSISPSNKFPYIVLLSLNFIFGVFFISFRAELLYGDNSLHLKSFVKLESKTILYYI
jgi:hypothetical protein